MFICFNMEMFCAFSTSQRWLFSGYIKIRVIWLRMYQSITSFPFHKRTHFLLLFLVFSFEFSFSASGRSVSAPDSESEKSGSEPEDDSEAEEFSFCTSGSSIWAAAFPFQLENCWRSGELSLWAAGAGGWGAVERMLVKVESWKDFKSGGELNFQKQLEATWGCEGSVATRTRPSSIAARYPTL